MVSGIQNLPIPPRSNDPERRERVASRKAEAPDAPRGDAPAGRGGLAQTTAEAAVAEANVASASFKEQLAERLARVRAHAASARTYSGQARQRLEETGEDASDRASVSPRPTQQTSPRRIDVQV